MEKVKITVNGHEFKVQEDDVIEVQQYPCDICGKHTAIQQERNNKTIKKVEPLYD